MANPRRWLAGWALVVGTLLWLSMGIAVHAEDQQGGPPPFPLLFEGGVTLNGAPVTSGELTVRIGDWESKSVSVDAGRFVCTDRCLIAGPPNFDYVGLPLTFHLDGAHEASLTFPFQQGPARTVVELMFGTVAPPANARTESLATPIPAVTEALTSAPMDDNSSGGRRIAAIAAVGLVLAATVAAVVRRRWTNR